MDTDRFDDLTRALSAAASRRGVARIVGGGVLGSLLATEAAAKKRGTRKRKRKKSKPCPTECCANKDCGARNRCIDGQCVTGKGSCPLGESSCDETVIFCNARAGCKCFRSSSGATHCGMNPVGIQCGQCKVDAECASFGAGAFCVTDSVPLGNCSCGTAGQGFCIIPCDRICPPTGCCVNDDCGVGKICVEGRCITGQGTCASGADRCGISAPFPCNENPNCFCYSRVEGGTRCGSFIGGCDNCQRDVDCAAHGAGAFCLRGGATCCAPNGGNRCALPCPT
jgi:hypothetical protein